MFRKVCQKIILYRLSNIKQLSRYKVDKQKIKALLDKNELFFAKAWLLKKFKS
jgi:hypothetical protein